MLIKYVDIEKLNLQPKGDCAKYIDASPNITKSDIENLPLIDTSQLSIQTNGKFPDPIPLIDNSEQLAIPYPVELLPEVAKNAVIEYQAYGQQPISLVACSTIANMSLACQGLANIARDSQLISPISLYIIVVAESGERKSASDNHFKAIVIHWERQKRTELLPEIKKNKALYSAWQIKKKSILNQLEKTAVETSNSASSKSKNLEQCLAELEQQEPQKIIEPNLYNEEVTTEALAYNLATGWQSTSLWSDEGGIVIGGHGMSQENATKFTALLNRLWDGSVHRVIRKTSDSFTIEGRRLTCSLMMQPAIFNQLINRCDSVCRSNGFLARCLLINPASTMGARPYQEPPAGMPHTELFNKRIYQLLDTPLPLDEQQKLNPKTLQLSPEAKACWVKFHNEVEAELRADGDFFRIKDFAAKTAENAARLAGIFHVFCDENGSLVGLETMLRAIGIMAWHLQETKRVMSVHEIPQDIQDAQLLADWLIANTHREIKLTDILKFAPSNLRDKQSRDVAVAVLIEHNYLRIEERENTKFAIINPKIHEDKHA